VQEQLYGRQGQATANFLNAPSKFNSKNNKWELNRTRRPRSSRPRAGRRARRHPREGRQEAQDGLPDLDQRRRQKTQAIVKQAAAKAGIELELKSVVASVFFASDPANWDTYPHFATDLQMYTTTMTHPDPSASWTSSPRGRWRPRRTSGSGGTHAMEERRVRPALEVGEAEMDPVKRAAMFIRMNDLLIQNVVVIPVIWRAKVPRSPTS
jgi:peptide/nickel transport system substrate-binding protein